MHHTDTRYGYVNTGQTARAHPGYAFTQPGGEFINCPDRFTKMPDTTWLYDENKALEKDNRYSKAYRAPTGLELMRDKYRTEDKLHQMPRLMSYIQPLYRHPSDYQHMGALEAGERWRRQVRDDYRSKYYVGVAPRHYGLRGDTEWRYAVMTGASMPSVTRKFEPEFPVIERTPPTVHPAKYKGFYNLLS